MLRKVHYDFPNIETITPQDYLQKYPCNQVATPCPSTWGCNGYNEVWLCRENDWVYRHLHILADKLTEMVESNPYPNDLKLRALKQATRELLLAQSSDWAFIMYTGTMVEYAIRRTKQHVQNFLRLEEQITHNNIDESMLGDLEYRNNIFPDININYYRRIPDHLLSAIG